MNRKIVLLLVVSAFVLSACSYTLRGVITDNSTGSVIDSVKVSVKLSGTNPRIFTTKKDGKYSIKKDDIAQDVTYSADGFEPFTTILTKEKSRNIFLIPTPQEMARRIVDGLKNGDFAKIYTYLHPDYAGSYTADQFAQVNQTFKNYLANVSSYTITDLKENIEYHDPVLTKTFTGVDAVTVVLTLSTEGNPQNTWVIHLQKMLDQNNKSFWHWLFNRTTNS